VELKRLGRELDFEVEVIGPVTAGDRRVSSSAIRRALRGGDFTGAVTMLGHPYAIHGVVEKGIGLGRKLGYPTANVRHNPRKLLPANGVYACRVQLGKARYEGMLFIGTNHFNPEHRVTVEANLFDFDGDLYGRELLVCPTRFIRENRRFDSADGLAEQIKRDKMEVIRTYGLEKGNADVQGKESRHYC
jgi:riboflavin kinase/FMN adenylyltransferase